MLVLQQSKLPEFMVGDLVKESDNPDRTKDWQVVFWCDQMARLAASHINQITPEPWDITIENNQFKITIG